MPRGNRQDMPADFAMHARVECNGELMARYGVKEYHITLWRKRSGTCAPRDARIDSVPADFAARAPAMTYMQAMDEWCETEHIIRAWAKKLGILFINRQRRAIPDSFVKAASKLTVREASRFFKASTETIVIWATQTGATMATRSAKHRTNATALGAAIVRSRIGYDMRADSIMTRCSDALKFDYRPVFNCDEEGNLKANAGFWRVGRLHLSDEAMVKLAARKCRQFQGSEYDYLRGGISHREFVAAYYASLSA